MFAMWGEQSSSYITYNGRVLVHDNREEFQFLFPSNKIVPTDAPPDECMSIKLHPQMQAVKWPLQRKDFR